MRLTASSVSNNNTTTLESTELLPDSGFDVPVFGLDNGHFLSVHIPAIICTFLSFICALLVILSSFHNNGIKPFFRWNKGDRFIIYMEICDAALNIGSAMSRLHILITRQHVHPPWLCILNAFITVLSQLSQALMVNAIAVNAFVLMHQQHDLDLGPYDIRLLLYTYGASLVMVIYFAASGQLGPNGVVCGLDRVYKPTARIITSGMQIIVFISNIVLYTLTWLKINKEVRELKKVLKEQTVSKAAVTRTAKTMTLLVLAFFIQWLPGNIFSIWVMMGARPPMVLVEIMASFSNLGGILNGGVYLNMKWNKLKPSKEEQPGETEHPHKQNNCTNNTNK